MQTACITALLARLFSKSSLRLLGVSGTLLLMSLGAAATPIPTNHWKFDDTTGTVAIDSAGANDGTYNGTGYSLNQPGAPNSDASVSMNGSDAYMSVTGAAITESFSIFVWGKSATSTWNQHGWLASARGGNGFIIHNNQGSKDVGMYVVDQGGAYTYVGMVTATDITGWHQYGLMYDATTTTASLVLDGVVESTYTSYTGTRSTSASPHIWFGLDTCCGPRFGNGSLDEAMLFSQSLSASELTSLYQTGAAAVPAPLAVMSLLSGLLILGWRTRRGSFILVARSGRASALAGGP